MPTDPNGRLRGHERNRHIHLSSLDGITPLQSMRRATSLREELLAKSYRPNRRSEYDSETGGPLGIRPFGSVGSNRAKLC
ncbi:hypothetical protein GGD65_006333 [Bradyrhizobium sp. CIR18]|nr:hypothetical protein [Bradyrhizobium sp. CIR18]